MKVRTGERRRVQFELVPAFRSDDADDGAACWAEGIAVPWNQVVKADGLLESFERGAIDPAQIVWQQFYAEHAHLRGLLPVGLITDAEDRTEGLWYRARISDTTDGRDVATLLRDKVLRANSIGFTPTAYRDDDDTGGVIWTAATGDEVSVVARPAYKGAVITKVRSADNPTEGNHMDEEAVRAAIEAALGEIRTRSEEHARQIAVLLDGSAGGGRPGHAPVMSKFRSLAAAVKALAPAKGRSREITDDELAELHAAYEGGMETRAYTGATTGELGSTLKPAWIDRDIKVITENRRIFELFSSDRLPAEGMSVEFPKFGTKTGDAAAQAAEGDDLTYIEIDLTTDTANIGTYGAYSQLTRQTIERSSVAYLAKVLQIQRISYGKVSNAAVRGVLTGYAGTNTDTLPFADKGKAPAWEERVLQAAADFESNSVSGPPTAWVMGLTHFRQAALLTDTTGRPIFSVSGSPVNSVGDVDLTKLTLNIGGLRAFLDPGLTGNYSYIASREAITTLESGPFNLTDENIVNLSKAFSLYGYLAITKNDAKGITKINHPAA